MLILLSLVDLVFYVLIILLFVRYFVDEQSMFAFGPVLAMLQQATDPFVKPIHRIIVGSAPRYHTFAPFVALAGVVLIHGTLTVGLTALMSRSFFAIDGFLASFEKAADVLFMFIVAMLFASTLFSKAGFVMLTSAGYRAFQEGTFKAFRITRMVWRTDRVWPLFWGSVAWLLLVHFVFASIVSFRILVGGSPVLYELVFTVHAASVLLNIYWLILLVAIIASWLTMAGGGGDMPMVRGVRALADPYFRIFRRLFGRRLRWGMIDFSPIVAFIVLSLVKYGLDLLELNLRGYL